MKLYYHPVSTTSRPIVLFATESNIALDYQIVDLFTGALDLLHAPDFVLPPTRARTIVTIHDLSFLVHPECAEPSMVRYLTDAVQRGLRRERNAFFQLFDTQDQAEGMAAFVEKRTPAWTGR